MAELNGTIRGNLSGTAEMEGTLDGPLLRGLSAYEIAVLHGYEGTESEWIYYLEALAEKAGQFYALESRLTAAESQLHTYSDPHGDGNIEISNVVNGGN